MSVRGKIILSMVLLTIFCVITVLIPSIILFNREVSDALLNKNDVAGNVIRHEIDRLKSHALVATRGVAYINDVKDALISSDRDRIIYIAHFLKEISGVDYCTILDYTGTVLLRTHEPDNFGDNISHLPQIRSALEGRAEVHFIQGPIVQLGISAGTPIYDEAMNLIGVVSLGFRLDNLGFMEHLQTLTCCEITFFSNDVMLATTLQDEDGTPLIGTGADQYISERVSAGETFTDTMEINNRNMFIKYFPLHNTDGEVVGMVFVGSYTEEAFRKTALFAVRGVAITLLILVVCIILSRLISAEIEQNIKEANEHTMLMLNSSPLGAQIWDRDLNLVDCNDAFVNLFGLHDKQTFINKGLVFSCSPEFQENGKRSNEEALKCISKVFEDGYGRVDWMFNTPKCGSPIPAEITLFRVKYRNDYVVVAYIRDKREIDEMKKTINFLEAEKEKIYYDTLTGIYNRRFYDESMERTLRSLARIGGTLSVLMVDIDNFKLYNDTYGHVAGDDCLKKIAEILSKSVTRVDDVVARYGGEEFIIVLPNTNSSGAKAVAEKIMAKIWDANISHEGSEVENRITISIGISTSSVQRHHTAETFLNKADEMLYLSKQNGKNQYNIEQFV